MFRCALLDEVAGHEGALQLGEEGFGFRGGGAELAIEASVLRALADQGAQHGKMADMGGLQHWLGSERSNRYAARSK